MTDDKPYANVTKDGLWRYIVTIKDGPFITIPKRWRILGYRRAVRRGKRELRRYIKRKGLETLEKITNGD